VTSDTVNIGSPEDIQSEMLSVKTSLSEITRCTMLYIKLQMIIVSQYPDIIIVVFSFANPVAIFSFANFVAIFPFANLVAVFVDVNHVAPVASMQHT